jgi:hypothetical protein
MNGLELHCQQGIVTAVRTGFGYLKDDRDNQKYYFHLSNCVGDVPVVGDRVQFVASQWNRTGHSNGGRLPTAEQVMILPRYYMSNDNDSDDGYADKDKGGATDFNGEVDELVMRATNLKILAQSEWSRLQSARAALERDRKKLDEHRKRVQADANARSQRAIAAAKAECAEQTRAAEASVEQARLELQAERNQLALEKQAWATEQAQIARTFVVTADMITINSGLASITMPRRRLTDGEASGTMFAAYLSGRHKVEQLQDGSIYVDSYPKALPTILAYLRDPSSPPDPHDNDALRQHVVVAAQYFLMPKSFYSWLESVTVGQGFELVSFLAQRESRRAPVLWSELFNRNGYYDHRHRHAHLNMSFRLVSAAANTLTFNSCSATITAICVTDMYGYGHHDGSAEESEATFLPVTFTDTSGNSTSMTISFSPVGNHAAVRSHSETTMLVATLDRAQSRVQQIQLQASAMFNLSVRGEIEIERKLFQAHLGKRIAGNNW